MTIRHDLLLLAVLSAWVGCSDDNDGAPAPGGLGGISFESGGAAGTGAPMTTVARPDASETPGQDGRPADPSGGDWDGFYRIEGVKVRQACSGSGSLYLAGMNADLNVSEGYMFVDVVDRIYDVTVVGDQLVAEAYFPSHCSGYSNSDTFALTRWSAGKLVGNLSARWRLPPDCGECLSEWRVRFHRR